MHRHKNGFTIVELIVVIVVIALLASLAIVGYGTWRTETAANVLKSDLQGVVTTMEDTRNWSDGGYPATVPTSFSASDKTQLTPGPFNDPYRYCFTARSSENPETAYSVSTFSKTPREGDCTPQVTTFAGSGVATYVNGSSTSGGLPGPSGMLMSKSGTLYVTEISGHRIRTVAPNGAIGLHAGSGTVGYLDGSATTARFNNPNGAAEDPQGNLYIADGANHRIRKILPNGTVETFAGTGTAGDTNGALLSAQFRTPHSIVRGKDGSFYVSESAGHRIRKISPEGTVSVLAGSAVNSSGFVDGVGTAARFSTPYGLAIDDDQNIYVADYTNQRIRKVSPSGVVSTFAGSGTAGSADGIGTAAQFHGPIDISNDESGSFYVVTRLTNSVRRISPTGVVQTLAGTGTAGFANGVGTSAMFNAPRGVTVGSDGMLYIADFGNRRIRLITF